MLSKEKLQTYLDEMEKGKKTLTSYNTAFLVVAMLSLVAGIGAVGVLIMYLAENEFFSNISLEVLGPLLNKEPNILYTGYAGCGAIILAALFIQLHKFMLKRKMKQYVQNHHGLVVSNHKKIFQDHSKESIAAFTEERNKSVLLTTLNTQIMNMTFFINNYENFSATEFEESNAVDEVEDSNDENEDYNSEDQED